MISLSNQNISGFYVGDRPVSAIYVGNILVWSSFIKEGTGTDAIALTMTTEAFATLCNNLRDVGVYPTICIETTADASKVGVEFYKEDLSMVIGGSADLSIGDTDTASETNIVAGGYNDIVLKNTTAQHHSSVDVTTPLFTSSLKLIRDIPGKETYISMLVSKSNADIANGLTLPNSHNVAIIQRTTPTQGEGHTSPEADNSIFPSLINLILGNGALSPEIKNMLGVFTNKAVLGDTELNKVKTVPVVLTNADCKNTGADFTKQAAIMFNLCLPETSTGSSTLSKNIAAMEPTAIVSGRLEANLLSDSTLNILCSPITELAHRKLSAKKDFPTVNIIAIMPIAEHTQLNSILRKYLRIHTAISEECTLNTPQSNNTQFSGYCLGATYASITLRQESQATNFDSAKVISLDDMTISQIDNMLIQS